MRIVFQGDSITDGNRYKEVERRWDKNHQIGHSYVFHIAGVLGRRAPGVYQCINRGVSGDSVESITLRWQKDTLDEKPDLLSLLLGINPIGRTGAPFMQDLDAHLQAFESGYRELLAQARAQNPALKLIMLEPFALPVGNLQENFDAFENFLCGRQAIVRQIADDVGAVFVPVQQPLNDLLRKTAPQLSANGWEGDPGTFWLWDGIHPTEQMHHFLAELWLEGARNLL